MEDVKGRPGLISSSLGSIVQLSISSEAATHLRQWSIHIDVLKSYERMSCLSVRYMIEEPNRNGSSNRPCEWRGETFDLVWDSHVSKRLSERRLRQWLRLVCYGFYWIQYMRFIDELCDGSCRVERFSVLYFLVRFCAILEGLSGTRGFVDDGSIIGQFIAWFPSRP